MHATAAPTSTPKPKPAMGKNFKDFPSDLQLIIYNLEEVLQSSDGTIPPLLSALHADNALYNEARAVYHELNLMLILGHPNPSMGNISERKLQYFETIKIALNSSLEK
ncbi:hypothetical protein G7Y89_g14400 [Cudoniella acicularis]|uniref:Uncharacterized protein n=1 Tax=Cudoniella acicularis TaxID=354080 RepID=A0A8H4R3X3_9HELO|nr:hypothetical protein G7Y89_g14400 [Cudoniella acicularis]